MLFGRRTYGHFVSEFACRWGGRDLQVGECAKKKFREQFESDMHDCKEIIVSEWKKRNIFLKLRNSLFRIISPLL